MIFNSESYISSNKVSPYELGVEGALMHVYENECNYNALMKAVGISELRYYQETGKDLFVHEAGAWQSFIEKVKKFFKGIIDKIVAIFNKFKNFIISKTADDKKFLNKYKSTLEKKDLTGMTFEGYPFPKLGSWEPDTSPVDWLSKFITKTGAASMPEELKDIDETIKSQRAEIVRGLDSSSKSLDRSDFIKILRNNLIGDEKQEFTVSKQISGALVDIGGTEAAIGIAQTTQKKVTSAITEYIKALDKCKSDIDKDSDSAGDNTKIVNNNISAMKSLSNDYTTAYGVIIDALKQRNKQNKAMCIKALSYKKDSKSESAYDLFSSVIIN